jgi:hypothetical protein
MLRVGFLAAIADCWHLAARGGGSLKGSISNDR